LKSISELARFGDKHLPTEHLARRLNIYTHTSCQPYFSNRGRCFCSFRFTYNYQWFRETKRWAIKHEGSRFSQVNYK